MSPLSIGVAITAAIALVAGVTKEGVDVLGLAADPTLLSLGAVGLLQALTTFRSSLISPFLRVFSTIFAGSIVSNFYAIVGRTVKLLTFTTTYFQANAVGQINSPSFYQGQELVERRQ